jgi:exonuclease III
MVIKQLKKYRIQIAALSETCMYDSGVKLVSDYTMIYSGVSHDNKTRKAHGVAICLDQTATKVWKDSGSEWEPISERIIKIRLLCAPIHITVIAVYSPVNPVTKQMGDESDKFYADLQDTINNVSTNDMLIIMGDLNARVGKNQQKRQQHVIRSSVGPFTVDTETENGTRLTDFCEINNIIISNTFFKHKLVHQTSWMHPRNKIWHMIDYTLVNKKFRSSVEDVRMFRGAAGAIGTDHQLMRVKIRIHLKSRRKNVNSKKMIGGVATRHGFFLTGLS